MNIKKIIKEASFIHPLLDLFFFPLVLFGGLWLRIAKFIGIKNLPLAKHTLFKLRVFPIVDHYYEPRFNFSSYNFKEDPRSLPGIDFNEKKQVELLSSFNFQTELSSFSIEKEDGLNYFYNNGSFPSGDSELYYSLIRNLKPNKIVEVGSGFSTRMAIAASKANEIEGSQTEITCIEPYEMPWLENLGVKVIRKKVEDVEINFFKDLKKNDFLFIDSSHIIRPGGDVLFEILEILPCLNKGVFIHFHDIFTPFEYPESWLKDEFRMWNEQYVLEAFLSHNKAFEIQASMAFLNGFHRELLNKKFPVLAKQPKRNPGSIWVKKIE